MSYHLENVIKDKHLNQHCNSYMIEL